MGDDRFEVFNTDTNPQLLLDGKLLKIQLVYSYGCLQRMFKDFCQQSVFYYKKFQTEPTVLVHYLLCIAHKRYTSVLRADVELLGSSPKILYPASEHVGSDRPPVLRYISIEQRMDHFDRLVSELVGFYDPWKH